MNLQATPAPGTQVHSKTGLPPSASQRMESGDFEKMLRVANILLWPFLAVAFATPLKISSDRSWSAALQMGACIWLPWMLLAPMIMAAVKRWCSRSRIWVSDVLAWLAGMVLCVGSYALVTEAAIDGVMERNMPDHRPPPEMPSGMPPGMAPPRPPKPPMFVPHVMGGIPIYLGITAFAFMSVARRRIMEMERRVLHATAELHRSRLEMLYAQLRPHFLFNALNTIASQVHQDPDVVDGIVTSLGVLLHETLESDINRQVTLERELELVEMYLNIERARFGDQLKLTIEASAECRVLLVPVLILQPVVENAVRHGLGPRKGAGTISIRASWNHQSSVLVLVVQDDGVGIKQPLHKGIGLENTRARLRAAYGEGQDDNVTVLPAENGGSIAILKIPQLNTL